MYLTAVDLPTYYPAARNMSADDTNQFLQRANSYAFGVIGGVPPAIPGDDGTGLKTAVALAFEIFAKGETSQVDPTNGNITESAPAQAYSQTEFRTRWNQKSNPFDTVDNMLAPYKRAFESANAAVTDRGVVFLGG